MPPPLALVRPVRNSASGLRSSLSGVRPMRLFARGSAQPAAHRMRSRIGEHRNWARMLHRRLREVLQRLYRLYLLKRARLIRSDQVDVGFDTANDDLGNGLSDSFRHGLKDTRRLPEPSGRRLSLPSRAADRHELQAVEKTSRLADYPADGSVAWIRTAELACGPVSP